MGGLGILFVIVFYVSISLLLVIKVKPILAKIIILIIAILLPTADAVYGRYKLKQMCEAEGGVKIYRVAHNVKGFMADAADGYYIKNFGYQFTEAERTQGRYYRVEKENDQIVIKEDIKPISKYLVSSYHQNEGHYLKYIYDVIEVGNREKLAEYSQILYSGGWAERFLAGFTDAGSGSVKSCTRESLGSHDLILSVLKP